MKMQQMKPIEHFETMKADPLWGAFLSSIGVAQVDINRPVTKDDPPELQQMRKRTSDATDEEFNLMCIAVAFTAFKKAHCPF